MLSSDRLAALYGLDFSESNIAILMRHRAVLFGLAGGFILYAAFVPAQQPLAFIAAFISMASFIVLAWSEGSYNLAIRKVMLVDIAAMIELLMAIVLYWLQTVLIRSESLSLRSTTTSNSIQFVSGL